MKETTTKYLLLRIYSNDELCDYLTDMLNQGWVIDKCRGNLITFRRQAINNARLAVVTTECTKPNPNEDEQVTEYISIALKKGWQLLCIGDFESLIPMRRRLYFYTCDADATPFDPDEVIDFQYACRARSSTIRWIVTWSILALAVSLSTGMFMAAYGLSLVLLLMDASLWALVIASIRLYLDRKKLYWAVIKNQSQSPGSYIPLRKREGFMIAAMGWLLLSILLALFI